jgi:hypothetical protein
MLLWIWCRLSAICGPSNDIEQEGELFPGCVFPGVMALLYNNRNDWAVPGSSKCSEETSKPFMKPGIPGSGLNLMLPTGRIACYSPAGPESPLAENPDSKIPAPTTAQHLLVGQAAPAFATLWRAGGGRGYPIRGYSCPPQ